MQWLVLPRLRRHLLHGLLADHHVRCAVWARGGGGSLWAVWFVLFACLPYSQERKGSGVFFLTCFWASLERSGVMLISSKWGAIMRVTLLSTVPSSWHSRPVLHFRRESIPSLIHTSQNHHLCIGDFYVSSSFSQTSSDGLKNNFMMFG